jgi:heme A synthase
MKVSLLASPQDAPRGSPRFARLAWGVLAYNVAVILWGAWVRITGSGAGCGSHWPTCNGEVIPRAEETKTLIEFAHRATSGLSLLFTVGLVGLAFRWLDKGHPARRAALGSLGFMVSEALLGAGLVIFGLVEKNDSGARAVVISLHLVNTLALLAFGALAAFWGESPPGAAPEGERPKRPGLAWLWCTVAAFVLACMAGAVTALGDTIFPVDPDDARSLLTRLGDDLSGASHFLVQLRVMHPVIAVGCSLLLWFVPGRWREGEGGDTAARLAWAVGVLALVQVAAGLVNIGLAAPGWMQIVHLLLADVLWIALVLLLAAVARPARGRANA